MKKVIFIKLGGGLITYKDKPYTVRLKVIHRLAKELNEIQKELPETQFVLGNGAGSFGHYAANLYNVPQGIQTKRQVFGFSFVQSRVNQLNLLVVEKLLRAKVNAFSIQPSAILTSSNGKIKNMFLGSVQGLLTLHITPVLYGDIVYDDVRGCKIFSTEDLFQILIQRLHKKQYVIEKVIHLTTVDGVLDKKGIVIREITKDNFSSVKKNLYAPEGYDVTGGMLHKVKESLKLAKRGIKSYIINGVVARNLRELMISGKNSGTCVC